MGLAVVLSDLVAQWASVGSVGMADLGGVEESHDLEAEVRIQVGHDSLEEVEGHIPCRSQEQRLGCRGSHEGRLDLGIVVAAGIDLVVGPAGSRRVAAVVVGIVEVVVDREAAGVATVEDLAAVLTVRLC